MARRRKHHRRSHHRRRRRHSGGGGTRGWMPPREDIHLYGAAAVVGYLETQAAADKAHFLHKVPRPVKQLGFTGGTALAAWVIAKMTGNRWARLVARGAAAAAAYQMGRHGGVWDAADAPSTMSGWEDEGEEHVLGEDYIAALESEGTLSGMPYDDALEDPDHNIGYAMPSEGGAED